MKEQPFPFPTEKCAEIRRQWLKTRCERDDPGGQGWAEKAIRYIARGSHKSERLIEPGRRGSAPIRAEDHKTAATFRDCLRRKRHAISLGWGALSMLVVVRAPGPELTSQRATRMSGTS